MKRLFDFILAILLLALLALPLALLGIVIHFKLGSPVFFRQKRPGLNGKPFMLIKFRTMTNERNSDGILLPDAARLTKFGRFLRSASMDELPELWNVLKGEMSFVGPRPLLMEYLPLYNADQMRRHEVHPGITGWAQINGRNAISWEEKFELDVWYVDNRSFWLDISIIFGTIKMVLFRKNINADGEATISKFGGNSY